jgi:hypothetical protein
MGDVGVIIPLYNKAAYVTRALESVFAQSLQDFEIVVVDDGSTDNGPEIVRGYSDPRLRLIRQPNLGPGAARNRGLRESTAPMVSYLDADDEWLPDFLERSVFSLERHPACVASICGYYEGPRRIDVSAWWRTQGIEEGPWRAVPTMSLASLKTAWTFFHTPTVVCRREAINRYGGFYQKNRCTYAEDGYLWLQIVLGEAIYRELEPLVWIHTEASELGHGRREMCPPEPILTDPEPIRANCPPEYRELLEQHLALMAVETARKHAWAGEAAVARELLERFPRARSFLSKYTLARCYLRCTPLMQRVRASSRLMRLYRGFWAIMGGKGR